MRRRFLLTFIFALAASTAWATMPANIENILRNWFDAAGNVAIRFKARSAPGSLPASACDLYFDRTSGVLTANCKNSSGTGFSSVVVGSGCSADASGNLACNSFISANQNLLTSPAINRLRLFDNTVNLTPDPRCADYGQSGVLTVLDSDESSGTAVYTLCAGTLLRDTLGAQTVMALPFSGSGGTFVPATADNGCVCKLFTNQQAMATIDKATVIVSVLDADDVLSLGIYNEAGTRKYYEGVINVTAAAPTTRTVVNAAKVCVGGTNAEVACLASSECPSGACTTISSAAPFPFPRGAYWACFGVDQVGGASNEVLTGGYGGAVVHVPGFTSTDCTAGAMPRTLALTKTWSDAVVPYVALSDE